MIVDPPKTALLATVVLGLEAVLQHLPILRLQAVDGHGHHLQYLVVLGLPYHDHWEQVRRG